MIGRGKYDTYPKINVPTVDMDMVREPQPKAPDVPIEEIIRVRAQKLWNVNKMNSTRRMDLVE